MTRSLGNKLLENKTQEVDLYKNKCDYKSIFRYSWSPIQKLGSRCFRSQSMTLSDLLTIYISDCYNREAYSVNVYRVKIDFVTRLKTSA